MSRRKNFNRPFEESVGPVPYDRKARVYLDGSQEDFNGPFEQSVGTVPYNPKSLYRGVRRDSSRTKRAPKKVGRVKRIIVAAHKRLGKLVKKYSYTR